MKKAAVAVNGRWVEVQHDLLPEVAWWTAPLGKAEVKVTVDCSSGEPRIAGIELRGRDITRTDRERLADLDTEQCINDVVARYGKRRPVIDGNAVLMAEDLGRPGDPAGFVDDPDVTRSVRTRRNKQRILLAEVASVFNESLSLDHKSRRLSLDHKSRRQLCSV